MVAVEALDVDMQDMVKANVWGLGGLSLVRGLRGGCSRRFAG